MNIHLLLQHRTASLIVATILTAICTPLKILNVRSTCSRRQLPNSLLLDLSPVNTFRNASFNPWILEQTDLPSMMERGTTAAGRLVRAVLERLTSLLPSRHVAFAWSHHLQAALGRAKTGLAASRCTCVCALPSICQPCSCHSGYILTTMSCIYFSNWKCMQTLLTGS